MAIDAPGLRKIELREGGRHLGFAVAQQEGTHCVSYPHVYGMRENMRMTLCLEGEEGAEIAVLCDGAEAGKLRLSEELPCAREAPSQAGPPRQGSRCRASDCVRACMCACRPRARSIPDGP